MLKCFEYWIVDLDFAMWWRVCGFGIILLVYADEDVKKKDKKKNWMQSSKCFQNYDAIQRHTSLINSPKQTFVSTRHQIFKSSILESFEIFGFIGISILSADFKIRWYSKIFWSIDFTIINMNFRCILHINTPSNITIRFLLFYNRSQLMHKHFY